MLIRQEIPSDYEEVFEVNRLAFGQDEEAVLVSRLRMSNAFVGNLSLVALINHLIVGHILFTKIDIVNGPKSTYESLALAPMCVRPTFQKKGFGGLLIEAGLNKARELGFKSVIVMGHEHYYPKFGFLPAEKWGIKPPFDVPSPLFMGIELVENGLKNVSGVVKYAKEFDSIIE
ncbi:MAG: N-acetyltransferase [Saprospiraceae bacterium]